MSSAGATRACVRTGPPYTVTCDSEVLPVPLNLKFVLRQAEYIYLFQGGPNAAPLLTMPKVLKSYSTIGTAWTQA